MPNYIVFAIPFFLLLIAIEWLYSYFKKRNYYRLNDTIANISLGIGNQVFNLFIKLLLLGAYVLIYKNIAPFHIPANGWSFFACLILFDFLFYWAHRLSHEINFLWGAHVVHHSSEEYNLSVALRQSWIHNFIAFFIFLPIPLLGFDPLIFGAAAGIDTLYQFWIHTKAINKFPKFIEFIFNTPSHHRVHHATNPKYIDKNHAGVFIVWDRLFGTFIEEKNQEEITYGITTLLNSWNPAWANWHYYNDMFLKIKSITKLSDKLKMLVAKPGWLPAEMGGLQPIKERATDYQLYDKDTSRLMKMYCVFQFVLTLVGTTAYLSNFDTMSWFYRIVFFVIILLSITIIGAIFEEKKWVKYAEYLRLFFISIGLSTFYYYWYIHWFDLIIAVSVAGFLVSVIFYSLVLYFDKTNSIDSAQLG